MTQSFASLLLFCRPGFEKECLAEVTEAAAECGHAGWSKLIADSGMVQFQSDRAGRLYEQLPELIFAREVWPVFAEIDALPSADRISPILAGLARYRSESSTPFGQLFCDYAEGDAYRSTARFAGKFVHPLRQALRKESWISSRERADLPALHAFFPDSGSVLLGADLASKRPVWPMGLARLKFPAAAPSRSTLKLEEAFRVFLGAQWREHLQPTHTGVDLGAAPGGWTWQLVNQGVAVAAIDNGPMDEALMATGLVEHHRADGFSWQPEHAVDWLVCDMVEQPDKVLRLMLHWLQQGRTQQALFNLKLPMKKRWQAWLGLREPLQEALQALPEPYGFKAKHLYFDREEITLLIAPRATLEGVHD
ncbi:MAG: 23S rRNA (cytidine(2498)-2'-O)-methyltransferase RlmM [Saccharospirillum sp.]|nr:23S rRNA (cytidine(2498)-2'-O)-methyltransferase RlmM [Saccharospirillum sp.]